MSSRIRCPDAMCGALDCPTCYPGAERYAECPCCGGWVHVDDMRMIEPWEYMCYNCAEEQARHSTSEKRAEQEHELVAVRQQVERMRERADTLRRALRSDYHVPDFVLSVLDAIADEGSE